jgi:hypothetical protein
MIAAVDCYDSIATLPDGKLNIVKADDPPFRPVIIDDVGRPALQATARGGPVR